MIGALKNDRAARKLDMKKQQAEGFELDAEAQEKPVGDQPARHAGAEVVDEG